MIIRCLTGLMIAIVCLAALGIVGTLIELYPRFFVGAGICVLAAISYVELGSLSQRGY